MDSFKFVNKGGSALSELGDLSTSPPEVLLFMFWICSTFTSKCFHSYFREGFKKKVQTWDIVPSLATPSPLWTWDILKWRFVDCFGELKLTGQFSSILMSEHLRRLGHSIQGVGPPPPLLGQCPKFVSIFLSLPLVINYKVVYHNNHIH